MHVHDVERYEFEEAKLKNALALNNPERFKQIFIETETIDEELEFSREDEGKLVTPDDFAEFDKFIASLSEQKSSEGLM